MIAHPCPAPGPVRGQRATVRQGLYLITPEMASTAALLDYVASVLEGGAALVQYRDKSDDAARRLRQASALQALCSDRGVPLVINDDVALAAAVGAAGVHVGETDAGLDRARAELGPAAIVGVSCYDSLETAAAAVAGGASYIAFGAVFASSTKPAARRASLDVIRRARQRFAVPIAAIGGITLDNAAAVVAAGADLLAVIADLHAAPDATARARAYRRLFETFPANPVA